MLPKMTSPASACLRTPGHMVEQPANFQAAEIGAERQPGLGSKAVGSAFARKFRDVVIDSRVLPDQRVGHGLAGLPVPQHGGLALVGDADRRQIGGAKLPLLRAPAQSHPASPARFPRDCAPPTPAADRSARALFARPHGLAGCVKHAEAGAGRALIDCADVVGHGGYGNGGRGMGQSKCGHEESARARRPARVGRRRPLV